MSFLFRRAGLLMIFLVWTATPTIFATENLPGILVVEDRLTSPNHPATIEATLTWKGFKAEAALGGEPLELLVAGKVVATAVTGGDGRAMFSYTPKAKGSVPFTVRIANSPRVAAIEANGNLAVWERRGPIMAVEMASLMDNPVGQGPSLIWIGKEAESRGPIPDAAEELGKVTQFYYNLLYVVTQDRTTDSTSQVSAQVRQWLKDRKFPVGYILVVPSDPAALGMKLDALHAAGWKALKVGVGRTKFFAETFLQRRLDAVMVPEPAKGEAPRKAKVAKEWKDVRRKL